MLFQDVLSSPQEGRHTKSCEVIKYHNISHSVQHMVFRIVTAITIVKNVTGIEWISLSYILIYNNPAGISTVHDCITLHARIVHA